MLNRILAVVVAIAVLAIPALADTIILRSGQRLEGSVAGIEGKYMVVTLASGIVQKIPIEEIERVDKAPAAAPAPATPTSAPAAPPQPKEPCAACDGAGKVPCTTCPPCKACEGAGGKPCVKCANGRILCGECAGRGYNTRQKFVKTGERQDGIVVRPTGEYVTEKVRCENCLGVKTRACTSCGGDAKIGCSSCKGGGLDRCPACSGTKLAKCRPCAGSGQVAAPPPPPPPPPPAPLAPTAVPARDGGALADALRGLADPSLTSLGRDAIVKRIKGSRVVAEFEVADVGRGEAGIEVQGALEGFGVVVICGEAHEAEALLLRRGCTVRVTGICQTADATSGVTIQADAIEKTADPKPPVARPRRNPGR